MIVPPDAVIYEMKTEWVRDHSKPVVAIRFFAQLDLILEALGERWRSTYRHYLGATPGKYLIIETVVLPGLNARNDIRVFTLDTKEGISHNLSYGSLSLPSAALDEVRETVNWLFCRQEKANYESSSSPIVV